ncbi:hypothetical protein NHX12_008085 [Muraenolepis orangiensis]|uniref:Receptor ligand binding region domain-containing protein n=1 Tax=Muraenolepis orangiensis TaxID=630683 RepID=A0A9Q0DM80_9TELE|nr:hypothetical protein NHX12_008085 [Muraenolepis orangiensis]
MIPFAMGFRQAQTMAFAVDEINGNSKLLPNISLGYSLYDSCSKLGISFRAALSMASGRGEPFQLNESCHGNPPVLGIVGDSSSTRTIAISSILSLYRVPMVSYFATCSCLSDRRQFPSFFRTIPSDAFQVRAMLQILRRFDWTWFGLLMSDDDYGLHAARSFQSDLAQSGGSCLAYLEVLPRGNDEAELRPNHFAMLLPGSVALNAINTTMVFPRTQEIQRTKVIPKAVWRSIQDQSEGRPMKVREHRKHRVKEKSSRKLSSELLALTIGVNLCWKNTTAVTMVKHAPPTENDAKMIPKTS